MFCTIEKCYTLCIYTSKYAKVNAKIRKSSFNYIYTILSMRHTTDSATFGTVFVLISIVSDNDTVNNRKTNKQLKYTRL